MKRDVRPVEWIIERPAVDLLGTVALVGTHLFVVLKFGKGDLIGWIAPNMRHELYGVGAAVIAIIFGFAAAAVAHYATASGSRARMAKRTIGHQLRRQWMGTLVTPGLAAFACLLALALDLNNGGTPFARWIFEAAVAVSVIKFIRVMYLFQAMLDVTDLDAVDPGRAPAPGLGMQWRDGRGSRVGETV